MAAVAQGEGGQGQAGGFCQGCQAGEGPVDGEGDQVGNELLGAGRQAADQQAGGVGEVPEPAEPAGEMGAGNPSLMRFRSAARLAVDVADG